MTWLVVDFLYRAGPVILVIFFLSIGAWYLILRTWRLYLKEAEAADRLFNEEKETGSETDSPGERETFLEKKHELLVSSLGPGREGELDIFCRCYDAVAASGLHTMKSLASLAPLLGLLGTVAGMIKTFQVIRLFGGANPALMAEGISQALLTTQAGLVAAFPIILSHALLKRRWQALTGRIREFHHSRREV